MGWGGQVAAFGSEAWSVTIDLLFSRVNPTNPEGWTPTNTPTSGTLMTTPGPGVHVAPVSHTHLVPNAVTGMNWMNYNNADSTWGGQPGDPYGALPDMWPALGYTGGNMTDVAPYQPRLETTYQNLASSRADVTPTTDGIIYAGWSGTVDASSGTVVSHNPALPDVTPRTKTSFKRFMVTYIIYYSG